MLDRRTRGFTVVELLVVIAIIGVLAALLLPAIQAAREAGNRRACAANLAECAKAVTLYGTSKGFLPPSRSVIPAAAIPPLNWVYPILPELEQDAIHKSLRTGTLPTGPLSLEVLMCPSQADTSGDYPLSYVVNGGRENNPADNLDYVENGAFIDKGVLPHPGTPKYAISQISKADGTSNTIMIMETVNGQSWVTATLQQHSQVIWWPEDPAAPSANYIGLNEQRKVSSAAVDGNIRFARPSSDHPGGFQFAMMDGSTHYMSEDLNYRIYAVLLSSNGKKVADPAVALSAQTIPNPSWQGPTDPAYPGTKFN